MSKRLCFDYGHGGNDPGAIYKGRNEKDDVLKLGKAVAKRVRDHGVIVDETRITDKTMSLTQRSNLERRKRYDYFISFHRNAFKPERALGVETFTYTTKPKKAVSLATKVNNSLVGVGFRNRGVKSANFHVLRETRSSAILIEVGFIDNTGDNKIFDSKFNDMVIGISNAILDELGIKPKTESKPSSNDGFYRVVAGSYKEKKNAENMMRELKKKGFDSFLAYYEK